MKMYEEDKFIIKDKDNKENVFYKLITFDSTITNKSYIIYADEDKNIYSSILVNNDSDNIVLEKIVDEQDKEEVNKALLHAKMSLDN